LSDVDYVRETESKILVVNYLLSVKVNIPYITGARFVDLMHSCSEFLFSPSDLWQLWS